MADSIVYGFGPEASTLEPGEFSWYCKTCGEGMPGVSTYPLDVEEDAAAHDASDEHRMNEVHESRSSRRG